VISETYLVDTSTWIDVLRKDGQPEVRRWIKIALLEEKVVISPPVKAEILSGAMNIKQFTELNSDFGAVTLLDRHLEAWEYVGKLNFTLRRKGVNVPLIDALIAAWAIVCGCVLVHHDRHYQLIKGVDRNLQTLSMPPFSDD